MHGTTFAIARTCKQPPGSDRVAMCPAEVCYASTRARTHIEAVRGDESGRLGAHGGRELRNCTGAWVDGLNQPGLANRDMHETALRIEEDCVWDACKRPLATHLSDARIKLYECATVAGDVQQVRPMPADREHPVLHLIEFGQPSSRDHRGSLDCDEDPRASDIRHAPSWPPGKVDRPPLVSFKIRAGRTGPWVSSPIQATRAPWSYWVPTESGISTTRSGLNAMVLPGFS
jgi:hypothetical protein